MKGVFMDFKNILTEALSSASGLDKEAVADMIEIPPNSEMGDFALPCFKLAKTMRKAPHVIAKELCEKLGSLEGFSRIETAGGYLNFFTDKTAFAKSVVDRVLREADKYGC